MCNQASRDKINEVIIDFTDRDQMFTAFDVSLEVQSKLKAEGRHGDVERHRDMKNTIHQAMDTYLNSTYIKSLQDVGAASPAFVYCPDDGDPTQYVPQTRKNSPPKTISVSASSTQSDGDDDGNDGDLKDLDRSPDQRGTVAVPAALLRNAGFSPRSVAYVYSEYEDNEHIIVVSKILPAGVTPLQTYTVDSYMNVRITQNKLFKGLDISNQISYDFESDSRGVIVKRHTSKLVSTT